MRIASQHRATGGRSNAIEDSRLQHKLEFRRVTRQQRQEIVRAGQGEVGNLPIGLRARVRQAGDETAEGKDR